MIFPFIRKPKHEHQRCQRLVTLEEPKKPGFWDSPRRVTYITDHTLDELFKNDPDLVILWHQELSPEEAEAIQQAPNSPRVLLVV